MTESPELDAILARAHAYQREVYTRLGRPPDTVLVTEAEYVLLRRWWRSPFESAYDGGPLGGSTADAMHLFGMRVIQPMRCLWSVDQPYSDHFKRVPHALLIVCRTARPQAAAPEICCPCGEVIWEFFPRHIRFSFSVATRAVDWEESLSPLMSARAKSPAHVADSERGSVEEWAQQVDAILEDWQRHVAEGER